MTDFLASRERVLDALRREMIGPDPVGMGIDLREPVALDDEKAYGSFYDLSSGEEILRVSRPTSRYGVGVLYPTGSVIELASPSAVDEVVDDLDALGSSEQQEENSDDGANFVLEGKRDRVDHEPDDDFDLTSANQLRPSAMGISFLLDHEFGPDVHVTFDAGRYEQVVATINGRPRGWWVRRPVRVTASFQGVKVAAANRMVRVAPSSIEAVGLGDILLEVQLTARPFEVNSTIVTVAVINRTGLGQSVDGAALFQAGFEVRTQGSGGSLASIIPYPEYRADTLVSDDEEAKSIALLYSKTPTFAIGHGCAANWDSEYGSTSTSSVRAECFPVFEAPSVTPDVVLDDGDRLEVPMGPLAGLDEGDDGFESLARLIAEYRSWIARRSVEVDSLERFDSVGRDHLALCTAMADRMDRGLERLRQDPIALRAFQLANRAVLLQQLHSQPGERTTSLDRSGRFVVEPGTPVLDWRDSTRGRWRAFQIGFLLASLCSTIDGSDSNRETVDLIFFPTGGGKTEAYLGLSAISMFFDRLTGTERGVSVIMRYTLRLLTTQQFVRAAALICAMETIRIAEGLGEERFSIGIWVGNSTTPGSRDQAKKAFEKLKNDARDAPNPFLLLKCPWCSAQLGPMDVPAKSKGPKVAGYRLSESRVQFYCPDLACAFSESLPIYVTDEDVYEERPDILIGTVDKFARLTWEPRARRIFGIGDGGEQEVAPPNLIIQDELHLISGPLGSMVGLYEGVIEDLCTDRRSGSPVRPKIVASTATIRKFAEQSKALFSRDDTRLFPPHGIDASDSFFAQYARNPDGSLMHGRRYVGISAPGLGSMLTAEVRAFSSLLQGAQDLPEGERDPWWTLLSYFNSLRELGIGVSLMQADIPEYLEVIRSRRSMEFEDKRRMLHVMELTSRLESDQVPEAFRKLEVSATGNDPVDVCLASNIIEVGIDIGRLSLMTVAGQPKSTSSYIQITGRVGRQWEKRPGLVVTVYSPTKPRDRSHFEKFRSYHQRLYGQVEPVSVTPFATPVLRRALHAAIVAYVRQRGSKGLGPRPTPEALIDNAVAILRVRVEGTDETAVNAFNEILAERMRQWRNWGRADWDSMRVANGETPILRMAGSYVPDDLKNVTWSTPSSMRDVDASCRAVVSTLYANDFTEGFLDE